MVDGHLFREVMSPTVAQTTGRGRNVIPDEFDVNVNVRFAPPRKPEEAIAELASLVGADAIVEATDLSPAGRPHASHPLVRWLAQCGVAGVQTKHAWTDVARFDAIGVPAVNFGPGDPNWAHHDQEHCPVQQLVDAEAALLRWLAPASA